MSRKIITFVLAGLLLLTVAAPALAAGQRARVYLQECCLGRFFSYFSPGVVLAAPDEAPIYLPTPADQSYADVVVQAGPKVCYVGGCYQLQGDGVTVAQQWVWVPNPPPLPPGLPAD